MNRPLFLRSLAPLGAALALLTGCSQATPLTVTAASFKFMPAALEVHAGQAVALTLRNTDTLEHDFQVDHFPAKMTASQMKHMHQAAGMAPMDSAGGMDVVHVHTLPGQSDSITFTPTTPGTYTVYCTVPGHKEAGMTATLVVR